MPRKVIRGVELDDDPTYITRRGKLLWNARRNYEYSSTSYGVKLVDRYGQFWGYSDDPDVSPLHSFYRRHNGD